MVLLVIRRWGIALKPFVHKGVSFGPPKAFLLGFPQSCFLVQVRN